MQLLHQLAPPGHEMARPTSLFQPLTMLFEEAQMCFAMVGARCQGPDLLTLRLETATWASSGMAVCRQGIEPPGAEMRLPVSLEESLSWGCLKECKCVLR